MNTLPMTAVGYQALKQELEHYVQIARPALIARVQQALGDDFNLSENAAYHAAVAEQTANETRIAETEEKAAKNASGSCSVRRSRLTMPSTFGASRFSNAPRSSSLIDERLVTPAQCKMPLISP